MLFSLFLFIAALLASLFLTPLARALALRIGFMDPPEARKLHVTPMPLLGGLAIYLAAVLAILLFFSEIRGASSQAWHQILGILGGASLLVLLGILDDRGYLHSQVKLLLGMPLSALLLFWGGIRAMAWPVSIFSGDPEIFFWVSLGFTVLWVVAVTASFSILDHMDGLCSGIAAIASGFFWILAAQHGQILVASLAAAVLGATFGFLRWNFNPARIFMGDSGALFIGFMMAALSIKLEFPELPDTQSWMVPVLILGAALFDSALVCVSRIRSGLNPFTSPGKDHTCHRLVNLGLGQRKAVGFLYLLGIALGSLGLVSTRISVTQGGILMATVVLVGIACVIALERSPLGRRNDRS